MRKTQNLNMIINRLNSINYTLFDSLACDTESTNQCDLRQNLGKLNDAIQELRLISRELEEEWN